MNAIQFLAEGTMRRDAVWLLTTKSGAYDYGESKVWACTCLAGRSMAAESGGKRSRFTMQSEKEVTSVVKKVPLEDGLPAMNSVITVAHWLMRHSM
jgi:hypothetical protein